MGPRRALPGELLRRGLAADDAEAAALIAAGRVRVAGATASNPRRLVAPGEAVLLEPPPAAYLTRAGGKLADALERFSLDVRGRRAIDVGAAHGGFTDCLLQRGAAAVVAVDVARGLLDDRLRRDPRVVVVEGCNVRSLAAGGAADAAHLEAIGPPASLVTVDVSFISLRALVAALRRLTVDGGDLLVLVKPQFEVSAATAGRGRGVVRDPGAWRDALRVVVGALQDGGAAMMGAVASPTRGSKGNVEFPVLFRAGAPPRPWPEVAALVDDAVDEGRAVSGWRASC